MKLPEDGDGGGKLIRQNALPALAYAPSPPSALFGWSASGGCESEQEEPPLAEGEAQKMVSEREEHGEAEAEEEADPEETDDLPDEHPDANVELEARR